MKELQRQANPNIVIALAGNKIDLVEYQEDSEVLSNIIREVPTEEAKAYALEAGLLFFETSAKKGEGVVNVFTEIGEWTFSSPNDKRDREKQIDVGR